MNKFLSLCLLTILVGFSAHAVDTNPIFAKWGGTQSNNGFTFHLTWNITQAQTQLTNTCTYNGQSLVASLVFASEVTDTQYIAKEEKHGKTSANGYDCNVDVVPGVMNYVVHGNVLTISNPANPAQHFDLTREQ